MDSKSQCGSPAGMGQLIKYFESQSRRLDRHTFQSCPSSLNPDFESTIKFNGVPILPPAMTSSRRDELRQLKKDAVLLEKRLRARHRQELLAKVDSLVNQSQVRFPDTSSRHAARQLNFDSEGHEESAKFSRARDKLEVTDSYSNFTETNTEHDDFDLQTMDSVNSDFMSLTSDSIPRVFSGLVLTSVKEQKISYDLDRLSKALNVQDLSSSSESDISDTEDYTHTQDETDSTTIRQDVQDLQSAHSLEVQNSILRTTENEAYSSHSFGDKQDTIINTSLELGTSVGNNVASKNGKLTQNSLNSTLGNMSSSMCAPTEGQWSNRSSPKSLKSAVHFASFVTEYINTGTGQSIEQPTVIKKKISSDDGVTEGEHSVDSVLSVIDLREPHKRGLTSSKISDGDSVGGLLKNVSFCTDGDSSPIATSFNVIGQVPFQNHERSSSDKENDVPQLYISLLPGHRISPERNNKIRYNSDERVSTEPGTSGKSQRKTPGEEKNSTKSRITEAQNSSPQANILPQTVLHSVLRDVDVSPVLSSQSVYGSLTISNTSSIVDPPPSFLGTVSIRKASASDSQGSNRSNTLTSISESSSNIIRKDLYKDIPVATMKIVDATVSADSMKTNQKQELLEEGSTKKGKDQQSESPKKLNIDASIKETDEEDKLVTPSRNNICRNSYTLSEPSPALVKALSRLETEKKDQVYEHQEKMNEQRTTVKADSIKSHVKQQQDIDDRIEPHTRAQPASIKDVAESELPMKMSVPLDAETEGKAEHINKYLNQVQFQSSMSFTGQSWDTRYVTQENVEGQEEEMLVGTVNDDLHTSVLDVLRSIADSNGSLEQLSVEELLELHQQQMNEKRQSFIRQQQRDMEELFVQQRREVMLLESEIKAAQHQRKEQHKFLVQNAPENIKVKSRNLTEEYSPEQTRSFEKTDNNNWQQKSAAVNSVHFSDSLLEHFFHQLPSDTSVNSLKSQSKSLAWIETKSDNLEQIKPKFPNQSKTSNIIHSSPDNTIGDNQTCVKSVWGDNSYSRTTTNMASMGIDNSIPEFSPSTTSPHTRRLVVLRSPLKYTPLLRRNERIVVPPEAYLPEMQVKFNRVSALGKGFLTRCLMKSDKVQELIKTIRDTREFAFSFQTETPIKKGMLTSQDRVLLERIIAQLQAAVLDIHEIFFHIPISERLALIEQTRNSDQDKKAKAAAKDNMRESGPKISTATLKALERKRKSREAETSAGVRASRPKTAPARVNSPNHNTDSRALRSLQSHSQISPTGPDTNRSEKTRPDNVKEKQPLTQSKRVVAVSSKSASTLVKTSSDSNKKGSVKLNAVTNKSMLKFQPTANKSSNRPLKSWR